MASKPRPPVHLIGQIFGALVVKELDHRPQNKPGHWIYYALCRCACGNEKYVRTSSLIAGMVTSCRCRLIANQNIRTKYDILNKTKIPKKHWTSICRDAKRRKIDIDITPEQAMSVLIAQNFKCKLSGLSIKLGAEGTRTASLDRIDSSLSYTANNIQWVHKTVNIMKSTLTTIQFLEQCKKVMEHMR